MWRSVEPWRSLVKKFACKVFLKSIRREKRVKVWYLRPWGRPAEVSSWEPRISVKPLNFILSWVHSYLSHKKSLWLRAFCLWLVKKSSFPAFCWPITNYKQIQILHIALAMEYTVHQINNYITFYVLHYVNIWFQYSCCVLP